MILKTKVRADILAQLCEKCNKKIPKDDDCIISFYRGRFIMLHEECSDFLYNPNK